MDQAGAVVTDRRFEITLLPMGESAVLVEVADIDAVLTLTEALRERVERSSKRDPLRRVEDLLPAARTVLVTLRPNSAPSQLTALVRTIRDIADGLGHTTGRSAHPHQVTIDVHYDGPDLAEVAELTGLSPSEVIAAHTGTPWRVAFAGFAPGFAYLVGGDERLRVPRRATPRTAVPPGSVGLAGEFSGVYPRESPGGWQLIGRTDAVLWDVEARPPALLQPGSEVHFRSVDASRAMHARPQAESESVEAAASRSTGGAQRGAVVAAGGGADSQADAGLGSKPAGARPGGHHTGSARHPRHPAASLEILAIGPRLLIQDEGRPGLAGVGVGRSGAADRASYRLGNRLLGNKRGKASLEVLFGGLHLRVHGSVTICLTGAPAPAFVLPAGATGTADAAAHRRQIGYGVPVHLTDGAELTLAAPSRGMRTYLAVRGGIGVPRVLGSRSTDVLSGLGPQFASPGTVLPIGRGKGPIRGVDQVVERDAPAGRVVLAVEPGPRWGWFARPEALAETVWSVSGHSNRVGLRLLGEPLERTPERVGAEIPSEGMVRGAIQVPPSGEPVLFLNDHPLTGGYPVIGVVPAADVDRAAQLQPGQEVVFRWTSPAIARP